MPTHLRFFIAALVVGAAAFRIPATAGAADKPTYDDPPAKNKAAAEKSIAKPGEKSYEEKATANADEKPSAKPVDKPAAKPAAAVAPAVAPKLRSVKSDVPLAVQAREAAVLSIPFIADDATTWINDRKCLSCHYVGYMLWSFHDAAERGFDIDRKKLAEQIKWSLEQTKGADSEGMAQTLLARSKHNADDEVAAKLVASFRDQIVKAQHADGYWKAGGQLPSQKRPHSETTQVSTILCVLGLATLEPHQATEASLAKALAWLKKNPPNGAKPAESSEWYALRLVVERRFGDAKQADEFRKQLLAAQRTDGGWGWRIADSSDAYGTGVALYALAAAGTPSTDPSIERAWKYLIETQQKDGSWPVNGTKTDKKDKPHAMSSFWGTTWALLGLSHTLPSTKAATSAATKAVVR